MRRLLAYEWGKLFHLPALWVFLGLCLAFNGLLLGSVTPGDQAFFHQTSQAAETLGVRVGADFVAGLSQLPQTEERDLLLQAVAGLENTFEAYDTDELANFYQSVTEGDLLAQRWLAWKYDLLQGRGPEQAAGRLERFLSGVSMDRSKVLLIAPPPVTLGEWVPSPQLIDDSHTFAKCCQTLEGILAGVLSTIWLTGCEGVWRAGGQLCATRTGRRLWRVKLLAALGVDLLLYALLVLATLGAYFLLLDYGGLWASSVSSQFNYYSEMFYIRPYLTWGDFTVGQYLAATLAGGGALTAVFTLLAGALGLLTGHAYAAAIGVVLFCTLSVGAASGLATAGWWTAYLLANFLPVNLWLSLSAWFTEMGLYGAVPWQETAGLAVSLALTGGAALWALGRFHRKDVA